MTTPKAASMLHLLTMKDERQDGDDPEEQEKAAGEIYKHLRDGIIEDHQTLVDVGLLEATVDAMHQVNQNDLFAFKLFGILAECMRREESSSSTDRILQNGGVEGVLLVADSFPSHEFLQQTALGLLFLFVSKSSRGIGTNIAVTVIESTVKPMERHTDSSAVFIAGCNAIRYALIALDFLLDDDRLRKQCIDCICYGIPKHWDNSDSTEAGSLVLQCLVGLADAMAIMSKLQRPRLLFQLEVLRNSRDSAKAEKAAYELVTAASAGVPRVLVDGGLFEATIAAMNRPGKSLILYYRLSYVLYTCGDQGERYMERILQMGGLEAAIGLMRSRPNDERVHLCTLMLFAPWASQKQGEVATCIVDNTVKAMEAHKDSAMLYKLGCVVFQSSWPSLSTMAADNASLFERVVECIEDGMINHLNDASALQHGRELLFRLVGEENVPEVIDLTEY